MTDEEYQRLKNAFETARDEVAAAAVEFDAAAAEDNTRRHVRAYAAAAAAHAAAVAKLKAARAAIEAAINRKT